MLGVCCLLVASASACGDSDSSTGTGGGGAGATTSTGASTSSAGQTTTTGAGGAGGGGPGCAPTICDDETPLDPVTAFGVVQGFYSGNANGNCDGVAPALMGEILAGVDYTIQVDSGGTIFVDAEQSVLGWNLLSPGDCDFACEAAGTTWVTYQDDVNAPTSRITFGKNLDGTPEVLIMHGASSDCVFYPLTAL